MQDIYNERIPNVKYPENYDYLQEQSEVLAIVDGSKAALSKATKELVTHIYNIASAFRQWKEQSFEELMTGNKVGTSNASKANGIGSNNVDYSVALMITGLNTSLSEAEYHTVNNKMAQVKAMRYLNIFYQLKYIWDGISTEQSSIFVSTSAYSVAADPYLVNFIKVGSQYQLDTSKVTNKKIINFSALLTVYILLGIGLLGISWLVFNRKDFA